MQVKACSKHYCFSTGRLPQALSKNMDTYLQRQISLDVINAYPDFDAFLNLEGKVKSEKSFMPTQVVDIALFVAPKLGKV